MAPHDCIGLLLEIMAALRTPATGCPWDLAQTFASIARYTIEEAYEVADAIARKDTQARSHWRGGRCDCAQGHGGPSRRAWRPVSAGRFSFPHGGGSRRIRLC